MKNSHKVVAAAAATLLAGSLLSQVAVAKDSAKEKCYGIAEAGKNDCASLSGVHSCAGQAKKAKDIGDWNYVATGTCKDMHGLSADEAKQQIGAQKGSQNKS